MFTKSTFCWWPGLCLIVWGLTAFVARAEPRVLTLNDCLALGREKSVAATTARRRQEIAETDIRRIRAQVYPSLEASGHYARLGEAPPVPGMPGTATTQDRYQAGLSAAQLVYSGGSVSAALRAADAYRTRAEAEVQRVDAALQREITTAYYHLLFREEAAAVARASVAQLADVERDARIKNQNGTLSELEWLSARVRLENEKPAMIQAENQRDIARSILQNLLYLEPADDWNLVPQWHEPEDSPEAIALAILQAHGRERRWEINQARAMLDVMEADIKVTEGEFFPQLHLFAAWQGNDPSQNDPMDEGWDWQWTAGVSATWKLFDGGARRAVRREKYLDREIAKDQISDIERATDLEIEIAYRNLFQARRALEGARETIALAAKARDIARLRLERGLTTNLEFSDLNLEYNKALIQRLSALFLWHQALADLDYAAGGIAAASP